MADGVLSWSTLARHFLSVMAALGSVEREEDLNLRLRLDPGLLLAVATEEEDGLLLLADGVGLLQSFRLCPSTPQPERATASLASGQKTLYQQLALVPRGHRSKVVIELCSYLVDIEL